MEKNKYLEQILQNLPQGTITYTHTPNSNMNFHYVLTAKNYKEIYFNEQKLEDLTSQEQLVLLNSNNSDPTYTPRTVLAGIFKARKIAERSNNSLDAIGKCNSVLIDLNREVFNTRSSISEAISQHNMHANLLEYYLKVEQKCAEYDKHQASHMAPIRNFFNRILEKVTRRPHVGPPFTQEERERGAQEWKKFRNERGAKPEDSNEKVLKYYRYNSSLASGEPFGFLYNSPELSSLDEEYATTNIALKILDGSEYKQAEMALTRKYLEKTKNSKKQKAK